MKKIQKFVLFATVLLLVSMLFGSTAAQGDLRVEYPFYGDLEQPEGVTIDKEGNMYVTLGPPFFMGGGLGEVWKIGTDGTATKLVEFPGGPGPAGLAVDAPGNLYFAFIDGVYRVDKTGALSKLPGTQNIALGNGLAFDKQGNLYVSDSFAGAVWRVPVDGSGEAEIWFWDPLLLGCGDVPVGANGIAYRQGNFYVANTSLGLVLQIPMLVDGSAGTGQIVAGDANCAAPTDELFSLDGIAFDVHGDLYAAEVIAHKLVKIDMDTGAVETLLTEADGLHNPASLAFGTGKGDRQRLFISNYAAIPKETSGLGPAILSLDVGQPGQPLP